MTQLYRYDDRAGGGKPVLQPFNVVATTPCGVWIDAWGTRRFVLSNARKRYAYDTIEDARTSYLARKSRQVSLLAAQLDRVRACLLDAKTNSFDHDFWSDRFEVAPPKRTVNYIVRDGRAFTVTAIECETVAEVFTAIGTLSFGAPYSVSSPTGCNTAEFIPL